MCGKEGNGKMTNGDKIRLMSDEELAELMVVTRYDTVIDILNLINGSMRDREEMSESVVEWLREEVQEDGLET